MIGRIAAEMQRDHGVDLRTGVGVTHRRRRQRTRARAQLSDGTTLDVDVVLASLGSIRNIEWLEGSGLAAGFWGVACDAGCRAFDINGVVTDSIFVAGESHAPPTCSTSTSSSRWNTGTTPSSGRRSRRTTW